MAISDNRLTQTNIQALPVAGTCCADQLLASAGSQRVNPADHGVATAQAQCFAGQLQSTFVTVGLQEQNALAVQPGFATSFVSGWQAGQSGSANGRLVAR